MPQLPEFGNVVGRLRASLLENPPEGVATTIQLSGTPFESALDRLDDLIDSDYPVVIGISIFATVDGYIAQGDIY